MTYTTQSLDLLRRHRRSMAVVVGLTVPHFAVTMVGQTPGLLAPWLQESLGLSRAELGGLTSARFVASSFMFLGSGYLVQRWGAGLALLVGLGIFGLSTIGMAGISGLLTGMLLFLLAGIGFALIHPATTTQIVQGFRAERQGTVMGIKETGVPLGGMAATLACPLIALHWGWRWAFIACGVTTLICAVIAWLIFRRPLSARGVVPQPFKPAVVIRLALRPDILATGVLQALLTGAQFALLTYLLLYFVEDLHLPLLVASSVLLTVQLGSWCSRLGWGMISDRLFGGRQRPVMAIICMTIIGSFLLLANFRSSTPPLMLHGVGFLLGASAQGWVGTLLLLRSGLVEPELTPLATAAGFSIGCWGAIIGPPLFGYVVDTTHSYQIAWIGTAALFVLALVLVHAISEHSVKAIGRPQR